VGLAVDGVAGSSTWLVLSQVIPWLSPMSSPPLPPPPIRVSVDLTEEQAWQLAQFLKRVSFNTCKDHTDNGCDEDEARRMSEAFGRLRRALSDKGVSPR